MAVKFNNIVSKISKENFGQVVITLADQGIVSATNFLTGVIIGRAGTKEEFGLYMLGFTIILLVMDLHASLISTPYMIYSPQFKGAAHALYTGSSLIHQFWLSAMAIVALAIVGAVGAVPPGYTSVVWALVVSVSFIMFREYARRVCFARLRMRTALVLDSFVALGQIGGLLVLAHFGVLSASRAYWVIGIACAIGDLAWLIWMRKGFTLRIAEAKLDFRHNWSIGKWIFASSMLWALSLNLYPWIIAGFHGTASSGVWAACVGVVAIGNPLQFGVSNALGPMIAHSFAQGGRLELRRFGFRASVAFSVLMIPFCLIFLVFGDLLLVLLYGAKYSGNGIAVSVLAVNFVVSVVPFTCSRALFAMGRADLDFKVNFVALLVMLTLGLWLVRKWGLVGAAYGLLITNIVASIPKAVICSVLTDSSERR